MLEEADAQDVRLRIVNRPHAERGEDVDAIDHTGELEVEDTCADALPDLRVFVAETEERQRGEPEPSRCVSFRIKAG